MRNRLQSQADGNRTAFERELRQVSSDHRKLVDAIIAGVPADQVKDRMIELDARRRQLEQMLSAAPALAPVRFHPRMADVWRERIGVLIRGLREPDSAGEAKEALRALIDRIVLVPVSAEDSGDGRPGLSIHLHGALASLLRLACGLPVHEVVEAAAQMQKAPRRAANFRSRCGVIWRAF